MKIQSLIGLAMTEKWVLFAGSLLLLVSSLATMAVPYVLGRIVDSTINIKKYESETEEWKAEDLDTTCLYILLIAIIQATCTMARHYIMEVAGERMIKRLKLDIFTAIMNQEMGFFDLNNTGELMHRLTDDTKQVTYGVTANISNGLKSLYVAFMGSVMMYYVSPKLTFISWIFLPPATVVSFVTGYYLKNLRQDLQDSSASTSHVAEERISNIRVVRAFGQEELEIKNYEGKLEDNLQIGKQEAVVHSLFAGLINFVQTIIIVVILYYGGWMVISGSITMGTLSAFLLYAGYVSFSLHALSNCYTQCMEGLGAWERLWELLNRIPSILSSVGEKPGTRIAGNIRFHSVSFAYPTRPETLVFDNVNLDIPSGSVLAIVGASGSGKSTLVSLLLRFYDPTSGVIKMDGSDISRLDPQWLRQQIGTVSQDAVLFSGTIGENILYGSQQHPDPTSDSIGNEKDADARVYQVAKEANALEFILRFSNKFETIVGEKGMTLSAGQRQRIAIARALIKNPRILIFDEATSALDAESEFLVQEALERVAKNRTVIIIAHRLSTIKHADNIAVVKDAKIAEVGTYEQLMSIPYGKFKKIVDKQTS